MNDQQRELIHLVCCLPETDQAKALQFVQNLKAKNHPLVQQLQQMQQDELAELHPCITAETREGVISTSQASCKHLTGLYGSTGCRANFTQQGGVMISEDSINAAIQSGEIDLYHHYHRTLKKLLLRATMAHTGNNKTQCGRLLGVTRGTVENWLKEELKP